MRVILTFVICLSASSLHAQQRNGQAVRYDAADFRSTGEPLLDKALQKIFLKPSVLDPIVDAYLNSDNESLRSQLQALGIDSFEELLKASQKKEPLIAGASQSRYFSVSEMRELIAWYRSFEPEFQFLGTEEFRADPSSHIKFLDFWISRMRTPDASWRGTYIGVGRLEQAGYEASRIVQTGTFDSNPKREGLNVIRKDGGMPKSTYESLLEESFDVELRNLAHPIDRLAFVAILGLEESNLVKYSLFVRELRKVISKGEYEAARHAIAAFLSKPLRNRRDSIAEARQRGNLSSFADRVLKWSDAQTIDFGLKGKLPRRSTPPTSLRFTWLLEAIELNGSAKSEEEIAYEVKEAFQQGFESVVKVLVHKPRHFSTFIREFPHDAQKAFALMSAKQIESLVEANPETMSFVLERPEMTAHLGADFLTYIFEKFPLALESIPPESAITVLRVTKIGNTCQNGHTSKVPFNSAR